MEAGTYIWQGKWYKVVPPHRKKAKNAPKGGTGAGGRQKRKNKTR